MSFFVCNLIFSLILTTSGYILSEAQSFSALPQNMVANFRLCDILLILVP